MDRNILLPAVFLLALAAAVFALDAGLLAGLLSDGYGDATVVVSDENGTELARIQVRVADTFGERYTGLSDTESLADGQGMWFVHPSEGRHAYVMREMDFGLDIVFVDADGTITTIHHAPAPTANTSGGDLTRYAGVGKYVLEVPLGYTNRTGIDVGDQVDTHR